MIKVPYVLALLALAFLIAALLRLHKEGWSIGPASKSWLTISVIFALVSGWLLYQS